MLDIKAKGTTLEKQQIVNLDSGRLSIPVPEWGFVNFDGYHQDVVGFKYYVQGSHSEMLLRFMYDPEDGEQRWAFRKFERITLFFMSDDEKDSFEKYVELHLGELKSRIEASSEFEYIVTENETKTAEYKRSLRTAIELKAMLEEFRQSCYEK